MVENNNGDIFDYLTSHSNNTNPVTITNEEAEKLQSIQQDEDKLQTFLSNVANSYDFLDEKREFKTPIKDDIQQQKIEVVKALNPQEENLQPLSSRFDKNNTSSNNQPIFKLPEKPIPNYSEEFENIDLSPITSRLESKTITPKKITNDNTLPSKADIASKLDDKLSTNEYDDDDLICPVDEDLDESGQMSYFFNLEKTLRFYNFNWLASKINIDNSKFETPFFQKMAIKLYRQYELKRQQSRKQRDAARRKQKGILILIPSSIVFIVIIITLITSIPNIKLNNGIKALAAGDYIKAEKTLCSSLAHNPPYCVLSQSYTAVSQKDYETAYANIEKLKPYQSYIKQDLDDIEKEFKYIQAKELILTNDLPQIESGLEILQSIPNHSDVADFFGESCYSLGDKYSTTDKEKSLKYFYMAQSYLDASSRFNEVADEFYTSGIELYNAKKFEAAQNIFNNLYRYNYKDAEMMYYQCIYSQALDFYKQGNFEKSNPLFVSIKTFKDSSVLIKDTSQVLSNEQSIQQGDE